MPTDFSSAPPYNVVQPGAYSATNASLLTSPSGLTGKPIPVILGTALGGQPDKPLYFQDPGVLLSVLRGGVGYDAARFVLDGGAPQVGFVRVGNAITQATLVLAATSGTGVTLFAKDWGSWANAITITIVTGPIITLQYTDPSGNVFTEQWNLTGIGSLTPAMIASAINGTLFGYNGSNYVTAVAGAGTLPLTNISAVPLASGTDGLSPVAGDWTNGLSAIETELVDIVIPATGDASVHAQVQTHCQNMSLPAARHERVGIYGGVLGESVAATITRIGNLRSGRSELIYPGGYDYNAAGVLTLYDPFYMAAKVAGMWCAQPDPATSLIHELVPIVQAEVDLSTVQGGALDQLLQAGVTPIARANPSGYWIVDALTGYNASDGVFRDMVKTRSADFVSQYMRSLLEQQYVGSKNLLSQQSSITQTSTKGLDDLETLGIIQDHLAPVVQPGPTRNGVKVSLPVMLVDTTKFIFITTLLQPSSTLQGSTTTQDLG